MKGAFRVVLVVKNSPASAGDIRDACSVPGLGRSPGCRRKWQLTPILLPGKSHGQKSLVGCNPWDCKRSDMAKQLSMNISLY